MWAQSIGNSEKLTNTFEHTDCEPLLPSLTVESYGKVIVRKYGSDPLKTYLPNSDIDLTLVPLLQQTSTATESSAKASSDGDGDDQQAAQS